MVELGGDKDLKVNGKVEKVIVAFVMFVNSGQQHFLVVFVWNVLYHQGRAIFCGVFKAINVDHELTFIRFLSLFVGLFKLPSRFFYGLKRPLGRNGSRRERGSR